MTRVGVSVFCALQLVPAIALGAGFSLPEQSARAVGIGGAGTAAIDGAAAVFYDPGALAFEDAISAELSGTFISPIFRYEPLRAADGTPAQAQATVFALPAVFAAAPLTRQLSVGLGAFSNFGLGITWPGDFDGRFDAAAANLTTFTLNPSAAYRVHENVGLGFGVDVVRGTVELTQAINFVDSEGSVRMGGGAWGVGANVGVAGRFDHDRLAVGLSYRTAVALAFDGGADFTVPREFQAQLRDQPMKTRITLPHQLTLGGSYRAHPRVRVIADLGYTAWSSMTSLALDFEDDALDRELRRDWHDTLSARVGAEFNLTPSLLIRVGGGYDPTPSPPETLSPSAPDSSRYLASAGAGYRLGNFQVDLGYLLVVLPPVETQGEAFPARYEGLAHVGSLSLSFRQ